MNHPAGIRALWAKKEIEEGSDHGAALSQIAPLMQLLSSGNYRVSGPHEERDELWQAVLRLPPRQRACIALRYYEDLPEREVAAILSCSVGTVKKQSSRALAQLRRELKDGD